MDDNKICPSRIFELDKHSIASVFSKLNFRTTKEILTLFWFNLAQK